MSGVVRIRAHSHAELITLDISLLGSKFMPLVSDYGSRADLIQTSRITDITVVDFRTLVAYHCQEIL